MKKNSFITIIGNVASGKSTMAEFLSKELHAEHVQADEFYKTNPFFKDAVADRSRWSLASDIWFLMKRANVAKQIGNFLKTSSVVQDSGLLISWMYANSRKDAGFMTEQEQELYNQLYDKVTQDIACEDIVIYLDVPVPILLDRIKKRGRQFEISYYTHEYLVGLQKQLSVMTHNLKRRGVNVLTLTHDIWPYNTRNKNSRHDIVQTVINHI